MKTTTQVKINARFSLLLLLLLEFHLNELVKFLPHDLGAVHRTRVFRALEDPLGHATVGKADIKGVVVRGVVNHHTGQVGVDLGGVVGRGQIEGEVKHRVEEGQSDRLLRRAPEIDLLAGLVRPAIDHHTLPERQVGQRRDTTHLDQRMAQKGKGARVVAPVVL